MQKRLLAIWAVFSDLLWRGIGLFLYIAGSAGLSGAIVFGSWIGGIISAWLTLMLGVVGGLGYAIAITGKATQDDVQKGIKDAIQKAQTPEKK
jgi:hypothetical protein